MRRIVELSREGKTTIAVLHDLNDAAVHAHRIVVMSAGTVVADGSPHQVLESELVSDVYGQPMKVVEHPFRDCPLVLVGD
jgi:iron complex transport system ATP-binding protein